MAPRHGNASKLLELFQTSVPLIPVGTRNGAIYYNREIYYDLSATVQDVFTTFRIGSVKIKISPQRGAPDTNSRCG